MVRKPSTNVFSMVNSKVEGVMCETYAKTYAIPLRFELS